jgi:hypothetical protein
MTRFLFTLLWLFITQAAAAQPADRVADAVAEIRRLYNEVSEKLARDTLQTPEFYRADITMGANDKLWTAIGAYQRRVQFYFEITEETRTERLVKAHEKVSFGKRTYAAEYLFNPKGDLVFYAIAPVDRAATDSLVGDPLEYVSQPQINASCHYAKAKLIQFVKGSETKQQGFLAREKELAQDGQARAKLLKTIFAALVKLN